MKALTVKQPWAHLIANRTKPVENRSWWPPESLYGERFAIHAGKAWDDSYRFTMPSKDAVTFGAIIAVATIVCTIDTEEDATRMGFGGWFTGPVGWVFGTVTPVAPIPCLGRQKLWNVSPNIESQILSNLASAAKFTA